MEKLFELLDSRDSDEVTLANIKSHLDGHLSINLSSRHIRLSSSYAYSTKSVDTVAMTPLNYAMLKGKWQCAQYLFETDPRALAIFPSEFSTPLHAVASCESLPFLEWFWNNAQILTEIKSWRPDKINQRNEDKCTPFMVAVKKQKHANYISGWVYYTTDYLAMDEKGRNVMHLAIEARWDTLIPILLNACPALFNIPVSVGGQFPLHLAAAINHIRLMQLLIQGGADIHARDNDLNTPLHSAARLGHLDGIMFLLTQNADPNAVNWSGDTALHMVVRNHETLGVKFEDALTALLSHGANPHAANAEKERETPWTIAQKVFQHERDKPKRLAFIHAVESQTAEKSVPAAANLLWARANSVLSPEERQQFYQILQRVTQGKPEHQGQPVQTKFWSTQRDGIDNSCSPARRL